MNKIFTIVISFIIVASNAMAATNVSTKSSNLDDLKERLATKVAQLRTSENRAFFGLVKSKTVATFVIETKTKDIKIDIPDDVTVARYLQKKRVNLTMEDVAKGELVTVYGEYDTTLELLKASFILIESASPLRLSGTVSSIDPKDFSLMLATRTGQIYIVDIETTTKVTRWDKTHKFAKSGFSKMVEGETIHVVGTPVPKKDNRISAIRILNLGNPIGEAPPKLEESTPSATTR